MSKGMIVAIILGFGILVKIFSSLKQIFKVFDNVDNLQKSSTSDHRQILDKIDSKSERVGDKLQNVHLDQRDISNKVDNVKDQLDKAQNRIDSMNIGESQVQQAIDTISNQLNQLYNQRKDKDLTIDEISIKYDELKRQFVFLRDKNETITIENQKLRQKIKELSPKPSHYYHNGGPSL